MTLPIRANIRKKFGIRPDGRTETPAITESNLEKRFAKEFLDPLKLEYVHQWEAKGIGRWYDYYIPEAKLLIEVDGDYWHGFGLTEGEMGPIQIKAKQADMAKELWAMEHGIALIRFWEHDINNNSKKVMKLLKSALGKDILNEHINKNKKKRR